MIFTSAQSRSALVGLVPGCCATTTDVSSGTSYSRDIVSACGGIGQLAKPCFCH
jgi:hypothetical protein